MVGPSGRPARLLAALAVSVFLGLLVGLQRQLSVALSDLVRAGGLLLSARRRCAWLDVKAALATVLPLTEVFRAEDFEPSPPFRALFDGMNVLGLLTLVGAVIVHRSRVRPGIARISR